jgi:hypothetical protein
VTAAALRVLGRNADAEKESGAELAFAVLLRLCIMRNEGRPFEEPRTAALPHAHVSAFQWAAFHLPARIAAIGR